MQAGSTIGCFFACIEDAGRNLRLVTHADEARHVGLYHDVLLGHRLALDAAIEHLGGVGNAHEAPGGQALRQRELQHHLPFFVSSQGGVAEGCLLQVLAQLHVLLFLLLFLFYAVVCRHLGLGIHDFFRLQHFTRSHIVTYDSDGADCSFFHDSCTLGKTVHVTSANQQPR